MFPSHLTFLDHTWFVNVVVVLPCSALLKWTAPLSQQRETEKRNQDLMTSGHLLIKHDSVWKITGDKVRAWDFLTRNILSVLHLHFLPGPGYTSFHPPVIPVPKAHLQAMLMQTASLEASYAKIIAPLEYNELISFQTTAAWQGERKISLSAVKQRAARKGLTCKMRELHTDRLKTLQHHMQSLLRSTEIVMSVKHRIAHTGTNSSLNKKSKLSQFGVCPRKLNHISTSYARRDEDLQSWKAVFEIRTKPSVLYKAWAVCHLFLYYTPVIYC